MILRSIYSNSSTLQRLMLCVLCAWMMVSVIVGITEWWQPSILEAGRRVDVSRALLSPSPGGPLLGTDKLGRDVMIGMLHGSWVAFAISIMTIGMALLLGLIVGMAAGFFAGGRARANVLQLIILGMSVVVMPWYVAVMIQDGVGLSSVLPCLIIAMTAVITYRYASRLAWTTYPIPIDATIQRLLEVRESTPSIFLVLGLAAIITRPSMFTMSVVMGTLFWLTFVRYVRAETMSMRTQDFVLAAEASGIAPWRIMSRHILTNILPSIYVVIAFAMTSVILLEASLSYLGVGLPLEEVTWGRMLADSRKTPKAWWLAVFPGLAIFLLLYAFNTLGDYLSSIYKKPPTGRQ